MVKGFEQQDSRLGAAFVKSQPPPQHGRKADKSAAKLQEQRSFQPRPGH